MPDSLLDSSVLLLSLGHANITLFLNCSHPCPIAPISVPQSPPYPPSSALSLALLFKYPSLLTPQVLSHSEIKALILYGSLFPEPLWV